MNEITVIDKAEIESSIAKIDALAVIIEAKASNDNVEAKKQASLDLAKIAKMLDAKRADAVKPALEEQRRINDAYKPTIAKLEEVSKKLINQVNDYVKELQRLEREQKAIEDKAKADALIAGQPVPQAPMRPVSPNVKVSTTTVWAYEVVDALQVPRQFLEPSDKKISDSIKAGVRSIPGIKIYQQERVGRR
jgi:single-stranded DNA-specific DHH superfamily exonuclease